MMLHSFAGWLNHLYKHTEQTSCVSSRSSNGEVCYGLCNIPSKSNQWLLLYTVGTFLKSRFTNRGHVSDLVGAISTLQQGVDCSPNSCLIWADWLNKLASWLTLHYEYTKHAKQLEQQVQMGRLAMKLVARNHASRPTLLGNFSNSLLSRHHLGIEVLEYLPLVHTRTLSRQDQQFVLSTFAGVASNLPFEEGWTPEALKYLEQSTTRRSQQHV